jgi:hypothetical protein
MSEETKQLAFLVICICFCLSALQSCYLKDAEMTYEMRMFEMEKNHGDG